MRPWRLVKDTFGREIREYWPGDKANAKLRSIKAEVVKELNEADCAKARQLGLDEWIDEKRGVLRTYRVRNPGEAMAKEDEVRGIDTGAFEVNPICSRIVHSGAMTTDRVRFLWTKFCRESQDPDQFHNPADVFVPEEPDRFYDGAVNHQQAVLPPGLAPFDGTKKKRGRPRKAEMVAAESGGGVAVLGG